MLTILMLTVRAIPPPLVQIEQATTLANNILQAQLGQVIGLVLVSITLVLGVFAIIFFRIINVVARQTDAMAKKTENDSKLIENMQITNRAIEHLTNSMDDQTLFLARIDDGMKANVALNTDRNKKSDGMSVDIRATLTEVTALAKDTSEGRRSAVDEIKTEMATQFEKRDAKLDRIIELLERVDQKLDDAQLENSTELHEIKAAVAEVRSLLPVKAADDTPPLPTEPTPTEAGGAR